MERNLTQGSIIKNLIFFSLPYLLSFFLQTLYGMADLFIIGQFDSTASVTAVSIGSQVMHMLTVMIVGLAMGTTVAVGRAVGEKRMDKAAHTIGNTVALFLGGSVLLAAVLLMLVQPIVSIMSTPAEAVEGMVQYLIICFIGIPFITAYNIISSIFRGLGDSKSPMIFIAVACIANILLDYLLIGGLKMGPSGAALGTTLSQTISVIIALVSILKRKNGIKLKKSDFRLKKEALVPVLKVGIPVALQDGLIQIAFILITVIANRRGLNDAAAVGIVEKFISMTFLVPSSMLSSVSALAAQNLGAGQEVRARKTLLYAIAIAVGYGIIVAVLVQFSAESIVGLFEKSEPVIRSGGQYLRSYILDCIFAGIHFCFSGYFCACERSEISFMQNIVSIVLVRIPVAYLVSKAFADTLTPMGLAAPAGSLLSAVICVAAYLLMTRRQRAHRTQG